MASSQSWTSWILDSYASSIHPPAETTEPEDYPIENQNITESPKSTTGPSRSFTDPSPFGPYTKTGRGGAGNFNWQSEQRPDLEAQRQSSLTERQRAAAQIEHLDTAGAIKNTKVRKNSSQYLSVGVGGAGNVSLVQSNEIQSPRSPSFSRSSSSPLSATFAKMHHGRGGAGNYAAAADIDKKIESEKQYEERIAAERTREKVEQHVESMLKLPQGALLSEGRKRGGVV